MSFDTFKSRVKIVREEEVVKKWLEEQSFKTEYECLNVPEPLTLKSLEEVEKHFQETHLSNHVKSGNEFTLTTPQQREYLQNPLAILLRRAFEEQKRFPLQIVTQLSQQFARHGLQFFKVNRTYTHVLRRQTALSRS